MSSRLTLFVKRRNRLMSRARKRSVSKPCQVIAVVFKAANQMLVYSIGIWAGRFMGKDTKSRASIRGNPIQDSETIGRSGLSLKKPAAGD